MLKETETEEQSLLCHTFIIGDISIWGGGGLPGPHLWLHQWPVQKFSLFKKCLFGRCVKQTGATQAYHRKGSGGEATGQCVIFRKKK